MCLWCDAQDEEDDADRTHVLDPSLVPKHKAVHTTTKRRSSAASHLRPPKALATESQGKENESPLPLKSSATPSKKADTPAKPSSASKRQPLQPPSSAVMPSPLRAAIQAKRKPSIDPGTTPPQSPSQPLARQLPRPYYDLPVC